MLGRFVLLGGSGLRRASVLGSHRGAVVALKESAKQQRFRPHEKGTVSKPGQMSVVLEAILVWESVAARRHGSARSWFSR